MVASNGLSLARTLARTLARVFILLAREELAPGSACARVFVNYLSPSPLLPARRVRWCRAYAEQRRPENCSSSRVCLDLVADALMFSCVLTSTLDIRQAR